MDLCTSAVTVRQAASGPQCTEQGTVSGAPPQDSAKYERDQNTDPMPIRLIRPVYSARRYRELPPLRLLISFDSATTRLTAGSAWRVTWRGASESDTQPERVVVREAHVLDEDPVGPPRYVLRPGGVCPRTHFSLLVMVPMVVTVILPDAAIKRSRSSCSPTRRNRDGRVSLNTSSCHPA